VKSEANLRDKQLYFYFNLFCFFNIISEIQRKEKSLEARNILENYPYFENYHRDVVDVAKKVSEEFAQTDAEAEAVFQF